MQCFVWQLSEQWSCLLMEAEVQPKGSIWSRGTVKEFPLGSAALCGSLKDMCSIWAQGEQNCEWCSHYCTHSFSSLCTAVQPPLASPPSSKNTVQTLEANIFFLGGCYHPAVVQGTSVFTTACTLWILKWESYICIHRGRTGRHHLNKLQGIVLTWDEHGECCLNHRDASLVINNLWNSHLPIRALSSDCNQYNAVN